MFKVEQRAVDAKGVKIHGPSYPHRLNFYDTPPLYDVTIEAFESAALNRLRILAEIESSAARDRKWDETKMVITTQCEKYLPPQDLKRDWRRPGIAAENRPAWPFRIEARVLSIVRRWCLSFRILVLTVGREELRRRFVKAETMLFKIRYETDDSTDRESFLSSRDFNWIAVDATEKEKHRDDLLTYVTRAENFENERYYKVRWTRVPDLVDKRRVFLKGGWAYVPTREQSSIIYQEFETRLERDLMVTARYMPRLDEDTRLKGVLDNLSQGFLAGVSSEWDSSSQDASNPAIKAEMVDDLAVKHFPMCMRNSHRQLRADHRLNHFGRLQYGLFLKVLGLSIEEAIVFWRKSFDRISDDTFNKMYKYNIRHSYGLEGKRANYPAKTCQQILTGGGDPGCPFRHFSTDNLRNSLVSMYELSNSDLTDVMNKVKGNHFHVACTQVFEITHAAQGVKRGEGVGGGESITHPNQYVAKSMELTKAREEAAAAMVTS
ncbi:Rsec15 protein [Mycena kentingensis (nom. inval.)]|nr:Rsec15 protein [Mycena kentingensis (nom. inval.)]